MLATSCRIMRPPHNRRHTRLVTHRVPDVVADESLTIDFWQFRVTVFGLQKANHRLLSWLVQSNDLEAYIDVGWPC
jgi:hypothetical protein